MISDELKGDMFLKYGKELKKGETLFKENDEANEVYIVISGNVIISKRITSNGKSYEKILNNVSEGEILGEMALFRKNSKRTASAYIAEDTKILVISKNTFFAMIRYNAEFSIKLMERLSYYVVRNNKEAYKLSQGQEKLLVIKYILEKFENDKSNTFSIEELMKDPSIESTMEEEEVSKILTQIARTKSIEIDGDNIKVISKDDLQKFIMILNLV